MSLRLEATEGPTRGQTHAISGISVIGRDPQCAVVIAAPTVSREHAVVRPDEGGPGFIVEDLDSRSGTFVNGVRTRRAVLLEGDRVQIGPAVFKIWMREDALAGTVDPAAVEDEPPQRPQTLRLTLDAVRFRLRAKDLESGAATAKESEPLAPTSGEHKLPPRTPASTGPHDASADESDERKLETQGPPETAAARLESIIELSSALAATHDQSRLAREVARRLLSYFPRARRVAIFDAAGSEGGRLSLAPKLVVDRQASGARVTASVKISRAVLEEAVTQRRALLSEDPSQDPRFDRSKSASQSSEGDLVARSVMVAPLCVGESVLGALYLDSQQGGIPFDEGSLRFLAGIASVVAPAVENARLFARVQAETQRRALLERYFSPDMVEKLLAGEVPLARDGAVRRGTILFTDIRGFTRLTDTTAPRVLVQTLNAYFEAMQRIVFRARGTVERFGGDSILAYWSVIDQDPLAPRHAGRAALAMQNELYRLNRELVASGRPPLSIGIGVNTGDVIAGDVGSAERYEFTVLGDAINTARRIEDLAGAGEVLVGPATLADIATEALVRLLPERTIKGKAQKIQLAALVGLKSEEPSRGGFERWDIALAATLVSELGHQGDVRLTGLEINARRETIAEVAAPFDLEPGSRVALAVQLPACSRAREHHGHTLELERPIELAGKIENLVDAHDTASPFSLGRLISSSKGGLVLLRVRLDSPEPLLSVLGVR